MTSSDLIQVTYTGTRAPADGPDKLELEHRPLLQVSPLDLHVDRLARLTARPTGLVVFSKNAVRSLRENGAHRALAPFSRHTWWAVGEKTSEYLHNEFGVRALYPVDQCFEGLQMEFEHAHLPKRVVAFTLEGTSRDLSPVLEDRGIDYYQFPVYRTEPAEYADVDAVVGASEWIVLTSPKGIGALFRAGGDPQTVVERLESVHIATIGPKTARAARDRGIAVDLVPSEPDREELLREIASDPRPTPNEDSHV